MTIVDLSVRRCPSLRPHLGRTLRFEDLPKNFAGKYTEQFVSTKDVEGPCWVWTACVNSKGYGQVWNSKRKKVELSHRRAYETVVGAIPEGYQVDHLCEVIACCNPLHLDAVTQAENNSRKPAVAGDFCRNGHPRTRENIAVTNRATDGTPLCTTCRICLNEGRRARDRRKRLAVLAAAA